MLLQRGVEGELRQRDRDARRGSGCHDPDAIGGQRRAEAGEERQGEGQHTQDPAGRLGQAGGQGGPEQLADRPGADDGEDQRTRRALGPQQEGQEDGQQSGQRAQADGGGERTGDQRSAVQQAEPQRGGRGGVDGLVDVGRQPQGQHRGRDEQHAGQPEHPAGPDQGRDPGAGCRGSSAGCHGGDVEPGVGLHQTHPRWPDPRDGSAARHAVRPREHQDRQGQRVEPERGDRPGHHPGEQAPRAGRQGQDVAAPVREAVEQRTGDRHEQRERQHRQDEVERDPGARLPERDREEQRAGQRDGDQGVARGVQRVHREQRGQPAPAGPVGAGRGLNPPDRLAADVPRASHGHHTARRLRREPPPRGQRLSGGGGCEIRTREGLPPTRFPSVRHRPTRRILRFGA